MVQLSSSPSSTVAALTPEELAIVERILATPGALRLVAASGFEMHLPVRVRDGLSALLERYARGRGVVVTPVDDTSTTQEAAVLLGVSRPTFVRLLETGRTPSTSLARTDGSGCRTSWTTDTRCAGETSGSAPVGCSPSTRTTDRGCGRAGGLSPVPGYGEYHDDAQ